MWNPANDSIAGRRQLQFLETCRAQGLRQTPQRSALFEVLAADGSHPTAEQLHEKLKSRLPSISLATVYRILDWMQRKGLVRTVHSPRAAVRYDANLKSHQHLVCRACGDIEDVEDSSLDGIRPAAEPLGGFQVEEVAIQLIGRCARCRDPIA